MVSQPHFINRPLCPPISCLRHHVPAPVIVGSGKLWSSGCQSRPPPHVRLRSEPGLGVRTEGRPTCWCRTGRSRCRQTPGDIRLERTFLIITLILGTCWTALHISVVPGFYCCPSRLQWCSHWCPQLHQWGRWTGRFLHRSSQTSTPALPQVWKPDQSKEEKAPNMSCQRITELNISYQPVRLYRLR